MCTNVILNYIIYAEWTQMATCEHMGVVLKVLPVFNRKA